MTTNEIFNLILSIVTIIIAVIALWQTQKQTKLSNKQHLFDRRLEKYLFFKELLDLYSQSKDYLKDAYKDVTTAFIYLTNSANLEKMYLVVNEATKEEDRITFLTKCEEFEKVATEVKLIWNFKGIELVSLFIRNYKELLDLLYRQHLEKNNAKDKTFTEKTYEDYLLRLKEFAGQSGLIQIIDNINDTYIELKTEKIEEKLLRELRLK